MKKILVLAIFVLLTFVLLPPVYGQTPTIVIDPAHGGIDPGVMVTDKMKEKDLTLKISLLVKKELEKTGRVKVVLTREGDKDLSVAERVNLIKAVNPKAVVSVHVNRSFGRAARGFEIYFPGFKGTDPENEKTQEAQHIIKSMRRTEYLNHSVILAQHLQRHLLQVFPKENRGLREARMELTESLTLPAVVVEIGFASNPDNLKKLTETRSQVEIARAMSRAIIEGMGKR